jgi:predicted nucleic acid-binding protein
LIYADSSFLVSLYLRDANSATARSEMLSNPQQIALSRIAALEVRNAFRLAVFRGWITPEQDKQLQTLFHSDSNGGFLQPVPFSSDDVFAEAERLSKAETAMLGTDI